MNVKTRGNVYEEAREKLSEGMEVPGKVEKVPELSKPEVVAPAVSEEPKVESPEKPFNAEPHEIPKLHISPKPPVKKVLPEIVVPKVVPMPVVKKVVPKKVIKKAPVRKKKVTKRVTKK